MNFCVWPILVSMMFSGFIPTLSGVLAALSSLITAEYYFFAGTARILFIRRHPLMDTQFVSTFWLL